jgi:hypothetical protein
MIREADTDGDGEINYTVITSLIDRCQLSAIGIREYDPLQIIFLSLGWDVWIRLGSWILLSACVCYFGWKALWSCVGGIQC